MVSSLLATTRRARPQVLDRYGVELAAGLLADDVCARENGHVLEHRLAPVAKAGSLHSQRAERAPKLVHNQGREGLALHVLGDDDDVLGHLERVLEGGEHVGHCRHLSVRDENVGLIDAGFHALRVGDEVGADVAAVELHPLHVLLLVLEAAGLLDGDDAVFADLLHDLRDQLADCLFVSRQGRHLCDLILALHRLPTWT